MFTKKRAVVTLDAHTRQAIDIFEAVSPLIALEQKIMLNQSSRQELWQTKVRELDRDLERIRCLVRVSHGEQPSPEESNAITVTNRHFCGQLIMVLRNEKIRHVFQNESKSLPESSRKLLDSLVGMALLPPEMPRSVQEAKT